MQTPTVSEPDWNAEAVRMADFVSRQMTSVRRGAMLWRQDGTAVVFGKGCDQDMRTQLELGSLRDMFENPHLQIEELGFGVNPADKSSWAMLVRFPRSECTALKVGYLNQLVALNAIQCGTGCETDLSTLGCTVFDYKGLTWQPAPL